MNSTDNTPEFWLDPPTAMGLRGWSLLIPAIASSIGFFCFAIIGFSFTEIDILPGNLRTVIVLTGAFTLAFGSEVGTLSSITEIYRKGVNLGRWDKFALIISVLSTVAAFILAFATLLGVKATWSATVQLYGPVILGILAALDSYGGFMEFGLYLNGYDKRVRRWNTQNSDFKKSIFTEHLDRQRQLADHHLKQQLEHRPPSQTASTAHPDVQPSTVPIQHPPSTIHHPPSTIQHARQARVDAKQLRVDQLLDIYRDDPHAPVTTTARTLEVGRTTVYTYLSELEQSGAIHRNGDGVEVLT